MLIECASESLISISHTKPLLVFISAADLTCKVGASSHWFIDSLSLQVLYIISCNTYVLYKVKVRGCYQTETLRQELESEIYDAVKEQDTLTWRYADVGTLIILNRFWCWVELIDSRYSDHVAYIYYLTERGEKSLFPFKEHSVILYCYTPMNTDLRVNTESVASVFIVYT